MHRRGDISDTLRQRVLSALHFGTARPGDRLPSSRTLAAELAVDARVVTAAYRQLERDGLVERRPPSRAFFVAESPAATGARTPSAEWLVEVFAGGLARGVPAPDLPEHARRHLETLRLRVAVLEDNRDHLVWLCRELREDFGLTASEVDVAALDDAGDVLPPTLRSADLLVTTAFHADAVRPLADRLGKPVVVAAIRPDLTREITRLLAAGPVYFLGTDVRFAGRLRAMFGGAHPEHVRAVIVGRDDVHAIPDGAPAYVMRTARDLLGGVPAHVRPLSTLRAFSPETQRDVLRYMLHANAAALGTRP